MSDEEQKLPEEANRKPIPVATRDWFLQHLVSLTNATTHGSLPVTLSINGMLVAGTLAGPHEYFAAMAKTIAGSVYGDEPSEAKTNFETQIAELGPNPTDSPDPTPFAELNFVHLRDAKFFTAGGQTMNVKPPVLWRGRLSQVTGWSFGRFETS